MSADRHDYEVGYRKPPRHTRFAKGQSGNPRGRPSRAHKAAYVAQAMFDLFTVCGKKPVIVKKDRPGQLGNRLQMALVREAVNIVAEGIADADADDLIAYLATQK